MSRFEVVSDFKPEGDQPKAIEKLREGEKVYDDFKLYGYNWFW